MNAVYFFFWLRRRDERQWMYPGIGNKIFYLAFLLFMVADTLKIF